MQFYSSDADAAEWLASISGDYIPEAAAGDGEDTEAAAANGDGEVIEATFGEESIG